MIKIENDEFGFFENETFYYKNGDLYGWKNHETNELKLYKPEYGKNRNIYISHKIYDKIRNIYYLGIDERINKLFDYIICSYNPIIDENGDLIENEYINLQYSIDDLLK